jgi:aminoglycoside phosphotransferase (APT) family kinase protein
VGSGVDDAGNEVLTYVEGTVASDRVWSDDAIWEVGRMLRDLHAATASFRPPQDAAWQPWWMHDGGAGRVIGHCDAGPWHVVVREGRPIALIDWTLAGPVDPLDEVVAAGWWNAQLHDDDVAERRHLPGATVRARQLGLFLDGYELSHRGRQGLVDRMIGLAVRDCAAEARMARVTPESTDPTPLWSLAWRARAADWMIRHRRLLERAVAA